MRTCLCLLVAVTVHATAQAVIFIEDFDSYLAGTTSWGSGGIWNEPTNQIKLDAYTPDRSLGPRMGNTAARDAHAELENSVLNPGEFCIPRVEFSAVFYWDHAASKTDGFFIVLSDDPATALQVPTDNSSTADPINAIAWGHSNTDRKDYSFFDGQRWTTIGWATVVVGSDDWETVSGYVEPDGSWSAASDGGGSGSGMLAVPDFTFDTVSIISYGDNSGYYSGIDDINVSAEVGTSALSWDGGAGLWSDSNWGGGQPPITGVDMIVDAASEDSNVAVASDFGPAKSVAIGESHAATVTIDPGVTLAVEGAVTLGSSGTLQVDGSLAAETLTTATGSTLGGNGTVNSEVLLDGIVAPGSSTGVLTFQAGLELGENALYQCELDQWDSTNVPDPWTAIPPTGPVNDMVQLAGGDALLGGTLGLTALGKLHPQVEVKAGSKVLVDWYGEQTRTVTSASGGEDNSILFAFDEVPAAQPQEYDLPGTGNWGQGHLGHGVFLTRHSDNDPGQPWFRPGITYTLTGTQVHLFQAAAGDTNGDKILDGLDIQAILSADLFGRREDPNDGLHVWPPEWPQGDFNGDQLVDGLDIQALLATGLWGTVVGPYWPPSPGAKTAETKHVPDDNVTLIINPEDGMLTLDTGELSLNGYLLISEAGIFTDDAPDDPAFLFLISGCWSTQLTDQMTMPAAGIYPLQGVHQIGRVIGPQFLGRGEGAPHDSWYSSDLTFTYTLEGRPGTFYGHIEVIPEPSALVMLLAAAVIGLFAGLLRPRRH